MSLFEILRDEREKVQRLRDALSELLAMCPLLPKPDTGTEHIWNQRVAAAEAIMKLTETKHNG
jgi:benzoyl-CoA reductase/2-hydroxyglutaryl-CoA dehydratase subunit BcrC/BadD/HgdB